ncbi:hypothetical protein N9Q43_00685 [bacterium]|nr:hypothetical protein [bacterium]|tara:strand:+ start:2743 stop:2994 length:252 start_codon:yes stop_codon:yes gene_type:complete
MESKQLSDKELQLLKDYQEKINVIIVSLGKIDLQIDAYKRSKEELLKEYQELEVNQLKTAQELQDKYGEGNIDLTDGKFTPIS